MEFLDYFKSVFQIAPGPAAMIVVAWFYFKSKKDNLKFKKENTEEYVKRSECHSHIDGLKEDISKRFLEIKEEIKELRGLLIGSLTKSE